MRLSGLPQLADRIDGDRRRRGRAPGRTRSWHRTGGCWGCRARSRRPAAGRRGSPRVRIDRERCGAVKPFGLGDGGRVACEPLIGHGSSAGVNRLRASGSRIRPVRVTGPSTCPAARVEGSSRSRGTKPRFTMTVRARCEPQRRQDEVADAVEGASRVGERPENMHFLVMLEGAAEAHVSIGVIGRPKLGHSASGGSGTGDAAVAPVDGPRSASVFQARRSICQMPRPIRSAMASNAATLAPARPRRPRRAGGSSGRRQARVALARLCCGIAARSAPLSRPQQRRGTGRASSGRRSQTMDPDRRLVGDVEEQRQADDHRCRR